MTNDVKHIFMHFVAITYLYRRDISFDLFSTSKSVVFLLPSWSSALYILDASPLSDL